ncbi:MAG: GNAT family N-acetyltransferase [Oligoflexia bacterium]|nr:GNAT family N-acetyltransferase [Oligoflexia bacterium]
MATTIDNFIDHDGIVKGWPAKRSIHIELLKYIIIKFDIHREYSEKEINDLIKEIVSSKDPVFIRRELIDANLLRRKNDGSKYWRIYLANIPTELQSTNLWLKDSKMDDLKILQQLYVKFNTYMEKLNGIVNWKIEDVEQALINGDLPPNGVRKCYQHKSIFSKENNELIGYMELYNGHPQENIYYIGTLYINSDHQKRGCGKEIVEEIFRNITLQSFSAIRLGVDIKNWPALYFWYSLGFSKITKLSGDRIFTDKNYMKIELERILN